MRILENGVGTGDASNTSPDHAVSVDPSTAERIEVVRGPATLLYGSSAIGGVVNVLDGRIPRERPGGRVSGEILGSGGTDFAVGLYATNNRTLFDRPLDLNGFVGGLALGNGDVLPSLQNDAVAFGGAAATWHWTGRFALTTQLYGQTQYFDSDVEELGGSSMQLAVGADITLRNRSLLRLAIVEDVSANATTDFAVHVSIAFGAGEEQ